MFSINENYILSKQRLMETLISRSIKYTDIDGTLTNNDMNENTFLDQDVMDAVYCLASL